MVESSEVRLDSSYRFVIICVEVTGSHESCRRWLREKE